MYIIKVEREIVMIVLCSTVFWKLGGTWTIADGNLEELPPQKSISGNVQITFIFLKRS